MADLANLRISVDSREVKKAATDLDQLNRSSTGVEQGVTKASSALRGFGAALASLGIGLIAREAILMADTFTRMSGQLALVTNSAQQLASAEKQLFALSQNTRVGYESTVSLFSRLARSTENLGVSQQSVMRVTETINKAMIVSGTSAEQASGALMQLGQAFASGALRGDELNSVMEGMPRVAQAIAEGMGITVGELRKLGAQGKLTGAEVYAALLKMGDDIDSEFSRMPMTVSQSMTVLSNSLMLFVAEADRATGFTAALADGIVYLSNNLNQIARVAEVVIVAVAGMAAAFLALRAALAAQALVAYIAQLVAAQFALGATTTAAALAGAGIRGLQAILASTGWGLAVVAIGAVVGAIYMLVTAQSEARGETQNLINDLGRLAATQDKNFAAAAKRGYEGLLQVQSERNVLMERNKNIEAYTAKSGMVGKVAIEYKKNAAAIKEANEFLIKNGNAIIESKKVYNQVEPPLRNVSAAIEKTGKKAKEAIDPLEKYRDALADMVEEGKKIGMTPEQIKAFDVEKLALEAAAAGRTKYNKASQEGAGNNIANEIRQQGMLNALTQQAADIRQQVSEKLKDYAKSIIDANKVHKDTMTTLKGEATLLGLVGVEREKAALLLEKEAYILKYGTAAWEEYHKARTSNIEAKSVIDKDIEALQTLTNNLETAAGMIGGKVGRSIQGILKTEITFKDGETKKISEAIASTFPKLGAALSAVIAGAQVGESVDSLFKSVGIKSSKAGAQIGGAIGMAAFGPVGAIAGSILGGVIGGMLKKTKTASATISQIAGQGMQTALSGNSAALRDVANTMATGLLKGLGSIAEQLGGTLGGNVKVSLGMRNKDFVVDPTGAGRTKGAGVKNFGEDQAAAVAYVTQLAIQQGIVTGISAGAQTLIRAGNDLNEQVQKALKFDQVFKDLVKESDPLRSSLDELSVEMEKLKVIFAEAGASAADYAKLEELYAIKQAKAIFDANRPRRELEIQLMEAQGNAAGALAARRQLELEAMDSALRPMQELIYALEDQAAASKQAAEQTTNVAGAERREMVQARRSAREARMEQELAEQEARAAEISALNEKLKEAYQRESTALQGTIDQFSALGDSLREFASTIIPLTGTGGGSLEELNKRFRSTLNMAKLGNVEAMQQLPDIGAQLRDSIIANATDRTSMMRQLLILKSDTESVAGIADNQVSIAEQQLETLNAQVGQFITLNESMLSVRDAIIGLQALTAAEKGLTFTGPDMFEIPAEYRQIIGAFEKRVADMFSGTGVDHYISPNDARNIAPYLDPNKYVMLPNGAIVPRGSSTHISAIESINFGMGGAGQSIMGTMIDAATQSTFANGGLHSGGLRIVGENGPELEVTGPSRIYNANQLSGMMNSGASAEDVKSLRDELKVAMYQIAKNTGKSYDLLNRWNGDGLPPERIVA